MKIYQVDAFADRPFTGNPAGVCIVETQDDQLFRNIAAEKNVVLFTRRRE